MKRWACAEGGRNRVQDYGQYQYIKAQYITMHTQHKRMIKNQGDGLSELLDHVKSPKCSKKNRKTET